MTVYALSIHADYRCRHSGACCTADWDIPVELSIYRTLADAMSAGRLKPAPSSMGVVGAGRSRPEGAFITGPDLPVDAPPVLERTEAGECVFFDRGTRLCTVHRDLGEPALPATCRHFPRVALRDRRGTFITLSHFCPTAASLLFRDDVPVEIVSDPPACPDGDYEGLSVQEDAWPPLLHPRMLMDLDGYAAWERHMVARCAAPGVTAESVVATLDRDARLLRRWAPGGPSLVEAVASLPRDVVRAAPHDTIDVNFDLYRDVLNVVPDDLKPAVDERGLGEAYASFVRDQWDAFSRPLTRYLAAKAFAAWSAYQGRGVLTIVRGLDAALALVRVEAARLTRNAGRALDAALLLEAFRGADFVLNHLAGGDALAAAWSGIEKTASTGP